MLAVEVVVVVVVVIAAVVVGFWLEAEFAAVVFAADVPEVADVVLIGSPQAVKANKNKNVNSKIRPILRVERFGRSAERFTCCK